MRTAGLPHPHSALQGALQGARPPQTLAQPMEDRQLLKRSAEDHYSAAVSPVDRQAQPRLLVRCWAAQQTRPQQRRVVPQAPIPSLRRSMAMRPRRSPLPLAQAGRPRQQHRPISEISHRFKLRPQAPLMGPLHQPLQSHRPVVSFLLPTRSLQGNHSDQEARKETAGLAMFACQA
jgi:hypothetical protein